eukprot:227684_1
MTASRFSSHFTGAPISTSTLFKCPFLGNKEIIKPTHMNCKTIMNPQHSIYHHDKKLYSLDHGILSHPLCPKRDGLELKHGEEINWRFGAAHDYTVTDTNYLNERIATWSDPNCLENTVSNIVKTLEMELTNKMDANQWVSMNPNVFRYRANDGPWVETQAAVQFGTYNILMYHADKSLYDSSSSFEESHSMFWEAFPNGFMWEILKIYSGPPKVAFTWRHWGEFGSFNGNKGTNHQVINVFGFGTATVDENLCIEEFEMWYDMDKFLAELNGTKYSSVNDAAFGNL